MVLKNIFILIGIIVFLTLFYRLFLYKDRSINRFIAYFKQDRRYKFYIGYPLDTPEEWVEIKELDGEHVVTVEDNNIPLRRIRAFIVAYPNGEILDNKNLFPPLPPDIHIVRTSEEAIEDLITLNDLEEGRQYIAITYSKSISHPKDRNYYTTFLKNISNESIRVIKFGGYFKKNKSWKLGNFTKNFFTSEQFRNWYGLYEHEWIKPGQSVFDPNNWGGRPVIWAYFCETESGKQFIAGEILN
ncbi:MAG: hypothetical protein JW860_00435 [Sedimentisphaerales bacterium]|nr:hypothetical protein [Sedimentisphaerales bacterium]